MDKQVLNPYIPVQTYFIRHTSKLNISDLTRQRLWNESRIAIHYPHDGEGNLQDFDNASLDSDDYYGIAKNVMMRFHLLGREGGYVCAQYYGHSELLLGVIAPKSKMTLIHGAWGSCERPAVLKTLQLVDTKLLQPEDHAVIASSRPQQGTFSRWHAVGDGIAALIANRKVPLSWESLSPQRQEVGCSEFLRLPEALNFGLPQLQSLILPVGRTLKDIDLVGIASDGKRIFAQVTYSNISDVAWKIKRLHQFVSSKKSHVILFCQCDAHSIEAGIHIFPVQQVFRTLNRHAWGRKFLRG